MTNTVYLTVGASASGKSTWARSHAQIYPNTVIACRDDIRRMMGFPAVGDKEQEKTVTVIQRGIIETALLAGRDVVVADTNLSKQFRNNMIKFCHEMGADVQLRVFEEHIDVLYARTDNRPLEEQVPRDAIRRQHDSLQTQIKDGTLDTVDFPVQSYEPYKHVADDRQEAVVVDIDHTVALSDGVRSPYDYTRVELDNPRQDVIDVVRALSNTYKILFVSGRDGGCREATTRWLDKHIGIDYELFMRPEGNVEPDFIIKNRIADEDLIPNYNIIVWIDDRLQVIRHVRSRGITVMDVAGSRF